MPRTATVRSAVIHGVTAVPVYVECSVDESMPSFAVLGIRHDLADELQAIVRCAVTASGYEWPHGGVTVAVTPLDVRKHGHHLALPVAAAVLAATGQVRLPDDVLLAGELSLDGRVSYEPQGTVAYARLAHGRSLALVTCRTASVPAAYRLDVHGIGTLADLRDADGFGRVRTIGPHIAGPVREPLGDAYERLHDCLVEDVMYRRSILVVGPHACTRHVPAVLRAACTPLTPEEALECAAIASVAGVGDMERLMGLQRPVRTPDPSISLAGLLGGGMPVRPGEVTLAHDGVLLLDDLSLWKPETLRQLDAARRDGHVRIARQDGTVEMPSAFQLVGCIAPCPCGHLGEPGRDCTCEAQQVAAWDRRIQRMMPLFDAVTFM